MTKKLLTFLTLLTLFFGVGWAETKTATLTMSSSQTSPVNVNGVTFTWTSSNIVTGGGQSSGFKANSNMTVTLPTGATLTSISKTNGNNWGSGATIKVYEGSSNTGTNIASIVTGTNNYTISSNNTGGVFYFENSTSKNAWIQTLTITYETGGSTPTTYNVTCNSATHGSISVGSTTSYAAGATVTITATPASGYILNTVTVTPETGSSFAATVSGNTATFTMPASDVTVEATFTEQSVTPTTETTFERITSTDDLEAGKRYIFVYETTPAVMGAISTTNTKYGMSYAGTDNIILQSNKATILDGSNAKFLTLGGNAINGWTFSLDGNTLNWISGNSLNTGNTGNLWTISFTGNNVIISNNDDADRQIGYNYTSSQLRFATYDWPNLTSSSSIARISLFKEVEPAGLYSITKVCDPTAGGTINCVGSANANDQVTVTVTPNPGYELSTLTVDGTDVTSSVSNNSYIFNMPAHDVTITATFALAWNAITDECEPSTGGEVWVNPSGDAGIVVTDGTSTAQMGTSVTFKVVPSSGFNISTVTATDASGSPVSLTVGETNSSHNGWGTYYTFIMPSSAVNITATFTEGNLYIIGTANDNTWNGNIGVQMTYDTQNKVFTKDVFFSADDYGYFSFADALSGQDGSWANMGRRYGAPENNYDLQNNNWTATWDSGKQDNSFKVPAGIYTVTVNKATGNVTLTPKTITVTLDKAAGQLETGTTVNVVSNLTSLLQACKSGVSATLAYSTDNGTSYTDGSSFPVNQAMTAKGKAYYGKIEAESDAYTYTVVTHYAVTATANPAKGGTVSVSPTSALAGETVTVTANPKSGYELTSITVNGDEIDITNTPYTFEMPAQATAVIANFTAKTLNLTINNDNSKGTVYGVPATSTVSSEISFTVTPKEGYTVNTVTYSFTPDGGAENTTTLTAPYKFNMPGYDVTILITYNEQQSSGGDATDLYHESFGSNSGSARDWDDSNSVKSGVEDVYRNVNYTVTDAKQSKNTMGYGSGSSALVSGQGAEGVFIVGPLAVANYTDLEVTNYFGMSAGTWQTSSFMKLSYSTDNSTYTEVTRQGSNPTGAVSNNSHYVQATYSLPTEAQSNNLYLKFEFYCYNLDKNGKEIGQAYFDEVNLSGVPNGVAAPVFTPAQGLYGIDVDVTISCPTSGATIYYTDDNSDPKTSTTRKEYTGEIVVSETTTFKAYAEKGELKSDVVTATYTINKNTEIETVTPDYFESFTGSDGIGKFTINNESSYSPVWSLDGNYGVKGTAYNPNTTPTNNAAVSRLVSPIIDLTNANVPELSFSHQINSYFTDPSTQCTVWIRETTDGVNGTWVQLPVTVTVPASGSWSNDVADIDLSGYAGKKVQISFLYSNPTEGSGAGTWEIQNFRVTDNSDIVVVNNIAEFLALENGTKAKFKNPVTVLYDYAQYSSNSYHEYIWVKDNSGYMQFYLIPTLNSDANSGKDGKAAYYENGDIIPAGFVVSKNYYENGKFVQAYSTDALNAGFEPATEKGLADPDYIGFNVLNGLNKDNPTHVATWCNRYITLEKIKLTSSNKNFNFQDENGTTNSCVGYNKYYGDGSLLKDGVTSADVDMSTLDLTKFYNVTGIIQLWQGGWEFMPIEFTEWEPTKVTLRKLCAEGNVGTEYTISNRLQCVYIREGNKLWVKDDNGQSIHKTTPAEGDNNYEIGESSSNTQLNQSLYDQSNWLEVHLADGSANAQAFYRHIIKGGAITGTFTNKTNPTMENVVLTSTALENSNEIGGTVEYAPNYYCAANFYNGIEGGNQACTGSENHGNFFFMNPKPQEYVQIDWAQWDGTKMIIPTGEGANEHRFNGEFEVNMSMNSTNFSPSKDTAYKFEAIVRRIESTGGNTLRANKSDDYIVYPLNLSDEVVTGINNVTGKAVAGVKYYNLAGMESDRPFEGVNIIVTTYTDGSRSSAKVLK